MQMLRNLDVTWERSSGRAEPAGSALQRPTRDSVMASPSRVGDCCDAEFCLGVAVGCRPGPPGKAVAIRPTMAACAETAWPFEAAVSERTLFVSKAATHQAASIPACAADRALSGYCHG